MLFIKYYFLPKLVLICLNMGKLVLNCLNLLNFRLEVISKEGDERGKINSLHINFLRQEDSGMFECMADNEAGDIVGYTWLRVKSKS